MNNAVKTILLLIALGLVISIAPPKHSESTADAKGSSQQASTLDATHLRSQL